MSDNPFISPTPVAPIGQLPGHSNAAPKIPGLLLAICIIALLLATGGLFGSLMGALGLIFQTIAMNSSAVSADSEVAEMLAMQQSQIIPNLIIILLNFVVAPLLIAGAIGVLTKKKWGRKVFRIAFVVAMIYVVIKAALTVYMQIRMASVMINEIGNNAQGAPPEMAGFLESFAYIGIAFMSLYFVALFLAYFFGFIYLKTKTVEQYCQTYE